MLRVWQPWPYSLTWLEGIGAGSIAAGTRSYCVIAVYNSVNTDTDAFGFARSTYSLGQSSIIENKTNLANAALTFGWTAPRAGLVLPDHYLLGYQAGATFDESATTTIFASVAGTLTSATVTSIASITTVGDISGARTVTLNPAFALPPVERARGSRGLNGVVGGYTYAFTSWLFPGGVSSEISPFDAVSWGFKKMSPTSSGVATCQGALALLRKWADKSWPIITYDSNSNADIEFDYMFGLITGLPTISDYLHERTDDLVLTLMPEGVHRA